MDEYQELKPKDSEYSSSQKNYNSKNGENIRIVDFDDFEDNLNISDIKDDFKKKDNEKEKKIFKNLENSSKIYITDNIDKDFSVDLDNINEDEFNYRKISLCSIQSEDFSFNKINKNNNENNNKRKLSLFHQKESKKLTKDDLNNIPLPVFSCIYCSNDEISFKHLSQEIISNKYLFQTSIFDMKQLNKLISNQPFIDNDLKNEKLLDIIIKNTEFITKYNSQEISYNFFKSNNYLDIINKEFIYNKKLLLSGIEGSIVKKKIDFYFMGINKISKNSLNNKGLFNSTNSLINNYNALSGFVEIIPINNNININNGKINNNFSNISINFNSISSNNNEIGNLGKDNNNLLVSVVEKIEKNIESVNEIDDKEEIMDFIKFDIERKIKKEDIIWDKIGYDIWNPNISDIDISFKNEDNNNLSKVKRLKVNLLKSNDKLKIKTSNNSFIYQIKKNLSISQVKSFGSTNNSSVINNENENRMKSNILTHSKCLSFINGSYNNNSKNYINTSKIKVNENLSNLKEKKSYSKINKIPLSNKFKDILNKIKINYKIRTLNVNKTKKINNNSIHQINNFSLFEFNSKNNDNNKLNSNIKNKTFSFNKIKIKEDYKKKNEKNKNIKEKYIPRTLKCYTSKTYKTNNSFILNKTPLINRKNVIYSFNSRNGGTKVTSSKLKFKNKNMFLNSFNNDYKKIVKTSPKKLNLSNYSSNYLSMKISFNGKKNKNSEIIKTNKNNNSTIMKKGISSFNKKINSSVIITNKINKFNKVKIKDNFEQGINIRKNLYNTKFNILNKTKISIKKKIIFPTSFVNTSTSKVVAIKKINFNQINK